MEGRANIDSTVPATTMYERLGGMPFFESLTERFYQGVATDEVLRPMYPEDLEGPRYHLCLFLAQFWGGPRTYDDSVAAPASARGTCRSRSTETHATAGWVICARPWSEARLGALEKAQLLNYFEAAANHMVNSTDDLNT